MREVESFLEEDSMTKTAILLRERAPAITTGPPLGITLVSHFQSEPVTATLSSKPFFHKSWKLKLVVSQQEPREAS